MSPREQMVGNWRRGAEKKVAAEAYFVEVMEAERQAHHEDGEGAIVPPSVAGRSCKEGKNNMLLTVNSNLNSEVIFSILWVINKQALISSLLTVTVQL